MQSIDHLMDKIAMKISELKTSKGTLYFSKIDLKYAIANYHCTQNHKNTVILKY